MLTGILLILANPSTPESHEEIQRTRLALVLDTSRSMSIGRQQPRIRQAQDLIRPLFADPRFSTDLVAYTFDERLNEIDFAAGLRPIVEGNESLLAVSLDELLQREPRDDLRGIVVVSDGRIHDASQLPLVLKAARQRGLSISTATIGDDWHPLNLAIDGFTAPRAVRRGANVPVRVRIRRSGDVASTALVRIRDGDGRVVARQEVKLTQELAEAQLRFQMGAAAANFTVELTCPDQELSSADNEHSFHLRVHDPKIRVLYMEATYRIDVPNRWRYYQHEFLEKALNEQEDIQCVTLVDVTRIALRKPPTTGIEKVHFGGYSHDPRHGPSPCARIGGGFCRGIDAGHVPCRKQQAIAGPGNRKQQAVAGPGNRRHQAVAGPGNR